MGRTSFPPMKTNTSLASLIVILSATPALLAAPAQRGPAADCAAGTCLNGTGTPGSGSAACPTPGAGTGSGACAVASTDTTPLALSEAAAAALFFQIDEERMAMELYQAFGAKWGLQPFANIPKAETRHQAMLRQLAVRAGLAAPTVVAGRFDSEEVQKRYDSLLVLGLESADSALRVGAYVEEVDIADLDKMISADNAALKEVGTALRTASGHHLRAFVTMLASRGITYTPQLLPAETYQSLVNGAGNGGGMGRGQGYRGGRK